MVKEVLQPPKYQCEGCDKVYAKVNNAPVRLFDTGGGFARVKLTDRYYLNHTPVYAFEHPSIQGQYWRYPELAFELPNEFTTGLRESRSDEQFEIKGNSGSFQFNERAIFFQAKWREFRSYLKDRGIANVYSPRISAEPINST